MTDGDRNSPSMARRRWLALAGGSLPLALAGCLGSDDDDSDTPDEPDDGSGDADGDSRDGGGADDGPEGTDLEADINSLQFGGHTEVTPLDINRDPALSLTLVNVGDTAGEFDLDIEITNHPDTGRDDEVLVDESRTVGLEPDEETTVTVDGVAGDLGSGRYQVTATAPFALETLTIELTDGERAEVFVATFGQRQSLEHTLDGGTVSAFQDDDIVDTAPIDEDTGNATLSVPLGASNTFEIEVADGRGRWPTARTTATFDGPGDRIDIVVGHPLRGADSYQFSTYMYDESGRFEDGFPLEFLAYGTDASNELWRGGSDMRHHNLSVIAPVSGSQWTELDEPPEEYADLATVELPEYGADMDAIADGIGIEGTHHDVSLNGEEHFYHMRLEQLWTDATSGPLTSGTYGNYTASWGLDEFVEWYNRARFDGTTDWQFVDTGEVRGIDVNIYEIPGLEALVHVDPETGYTLRYEELTLIYNLFDGGGGEPPFENDFEVSEFFNHDEIDTLDWELIRERTTDEIRGDDLDELPWEAAGVDV